MRRPRPALHVALPLLLAVGVTLGCPAPASADPFEPNRPLGVIGDGNASFHYDALARVVEVRLTGSIPASSTRTVGTWAAVIVGHQQTTPTSVPVPITLTWTDPSYAVSETFTFPASGATGSLTVDFSYTAVGAYVLVHSVHTLEWNPVTGMNTTGGDVG